jgi:hypothetical protein
VTVTVLRLALATLGWQSCSGHGFANASAANAQRG